MRTQRASSSPSIRSGAGPPLSLTFSSTSSAMVRTRRGLPALVITKASVMASTLPTSRITVSSPFLPSAARAAAMHQSWTRSRFSSLLVVITPVRGRLSRSHRTRGGPQPQRDEQGDGDAEDDGEHEEGDDPVHPPANGRSWRRLRVLGNG